MSPRSPRFTVALVLSAAIHIGLLAAIAFLPRQKAQPVEEPPDIVVLELAALGEPEAPPPEPEQAPAPVPAPPPQAEPEPEPEPEPAEVEPEPEPEPPPPDITAKPEPKPEPPKPPEPVAPPPAVAAPQPPPQPAPPPERQEPAPPVATAPARETAPKKGIKEGVAGGVSQDEMNRYITTLFTMIDKRKVYPSQSLRRREEGTVIVRLKIAANGELLDVTSPTGEPERLVDASLNAVRRAAPFPPLPESFKDGQAEFQVPVVYKLQ